MQLDHAAAASLDGPRAADQDPAASAASLAARAAPAAARPTQSAADGPAAVALHALIDETVQARQPAETDEGEWELECEEKRKYGSLALHFTHSSGN